MNNGVLVCAEGEHFAARPLRQVAMVVGSERPTGGEEKLVGSGALPTSILNPLGVREG